MKQVRSVLKWQMVRLFCIYSILSFIGMFIFLARYNPLLDNQSLQNQYNSFVREYVESIEKTVNLAGSLVEAEVNDEANAQHYQRILNDVLDMNDAFVNAYYIDDQSRIYSDHNKNLLADRVESYIDEDESDFYSEIYYNDRLKMNMVTIASRVGDYEGQYKGWIAVDIELMPLIQNLQYKINQQVYMKLPNGKLFSANGLTDEKNVSHFFDTQIDVDYANLSIIIEGGRWDHLFNELMVNVPATMMSVLIIVLFAFYCYNKYVNMEKRIENDFVLQVYNDESEENKVISTLQLQLHSQIEAKKEEINWNNKKYDKLLSELLIFEEESQEEVKYIERLKEDVQLERKKVKWLSNNLSAMVWIADKNDNLLFVNDSIRDQLDQEDLKHVGDIIEDYPLVKKVFNRRDYHKIKLKINSRNPEDALEAKTQRIVLDNGSELMVGIMRLNSYETQMYNNYLKKSRDLHFINEVGKIINEKASIDQILQNVIDKVAFLGNYNSCTIRLLDDENQLEIKALSGYSKAYVLEEKIRASKTHMWEALQKNEIILVNHPDQMLFSDESINQLIEEGQSIIYYPLANYEKKFGMLTIISDIPFSQEIRVLLESISINITVSLEKILIFNELKANYFKTVEAFVAAAEIKAERNRGHSRRVAELCKIMAQKLFLSDQECDDVFITGLLHDVGKLAFGDDEYESNRYGNHPMIGRKMVENVGVSIDVLEGIEHHHADYFIDGKEQPYYAQFVRLANDFDLFATHTRQPMAFFDAYGSFSGTIYSQQLFNVLRNTIGNDSVLMNELYRF